ncbi:alpha/beta fold hydrolase [Streptomyces sp. MMG1121]|uniref:alpha/beta fold hydrolase n=1 Tax=Streptomyces sp. MMG1121 TaxID=1415544 RepID=UPI001F3F352E|nr:alpha/beta fold hydrolase [Streptomyces sp. MMG1121]
MEGQRAVRQQLSTLLTDADLDRLTVVGARVRPEVVRDLVDAWNTGHPDGARPSRYTGPVLVVRGDDDGFITPDLVAGGVVKRFASAKSVVIDRAGHWVHIERPAAVAAELDDFLEETFTAPSGICPKDTDGAAAKARLHETKETHTWQSARTLNSPPRAQ